MRSAIPKLESPPRGPESLLRRDAVVSTLAVSPRTFDRMLSGRTFPGPDLRIGRLTLWLPSTVAAWIEAESGRQEEGRVMDYGADVLDTNPEAHGMTPADDVPESICLADVESEEIDWLWPDRFAVSKLALIAGDPGVGKSTVTLEIAAIVSQGCPWPDTPDVAAERGSVIILSAEDGLADTIKPRLEVAGADTRRIFAMTTVRKPDGTLDTFKLKRDLPRLEAEILRRGNVRVVIIDPVTAFLGGTDDHKNGDPRGLLAPLKEMAEQLRIAVILVTHLNKNIAGKSIQRVMGSIAYVAAVRTAFLVIEDPDDSKRRLMLRIKSNISPKTTGLAFKIVNGAIVWEDNPVNINADQLLAKEQHVHRPESKTDKAVSFLVKLLSGGPKTANGVYEAGDAEGFARNTLIRAAERVGINHERVGYGNGGYWTWSLPSSSPTVTEPPEPEEAGFYETYGESENVA